MSNTFLKWLKRLIVIRMHTEASDRLKNAKDDIECSTQFFKEKREGFTAKLNHEDRWMKSA